jgi:hypothetical protein
MDAVEEYIARVTRSVNTLPGRLEAIYITVCAE